MNFSQTKFCQTLISAPTREEANQFSDALVSSKLIAGSLIVEGASRYWWEGDIVEKTYWNVQAFTLFENKQRIIEEVEKIASDECPIVAFFPLDGNEKFLKWIRDSLS